MGWEKGSPAGRGREENWQDGTSPSLFYDFVAKNVSMPSDLGELLAYVVLLVVTWYVLMFLLRFVLSLVKPVIIVVVALFMFQFLTSMSFSGTATLLLDIADRLIHLLGSVLSRVWDVFLK